MSKSMLSFGQELDGVSMIRATQHEDLRGTFAEIFQKSWNTVVNPVQWSIVKSEKNVLRGMHYHQRHDEYFSLIAGHCLVALKDVRPDSPTFGGYSLYELFDDAVGIAFPRGLIHGWYFYVPSMHLQGVSESYVDYHNDDNYGCRWDAADLGIPWPFTKPILSGRSLGFSTVADLLRHTK